MEKRIAEAQGINMLVSKVSEWIQSVTGNWDYLTVALIGFLLALLIHHLMILSTLRRLKSEINAQRLIKKEYAAMPPFYDFVSFFFVLAGVLLILFLWFRQVPLVPFISTVGALLLSLLCFVLSGYMYLVGVVRAAIQVIEDLFRKSKV